MSQTDPFSDQIVLEKRKVKKPLKYRVLLHNDNYTTMDFVVWILCSVFHKPVEVATQIMLSVHEKGVGECGIYVREIAETKVALVRTHAQAAGFPLKCTFEPVEI